MKAGDLVRLPPDGFFWWSQKVGIITRVDQAYYSRRGTGGWIAYIFVDGNTTKFSLDHLELISESR